MYRVYHGVLVSRVCVTSINCDFYVKKKIKKKLIVIFIQKRFNLEVYIMLVKEIENRKGKMTWVGCGDKARGK